MHCQQVTGLFQDLLGPTDLDLVLLHGCLLMGEVCGSRWLGLVGNREHTHKCINLWKRTNVHIKTNGINEFFPFPMQIIKNNFKKISQEKISTDASYSFWAKAKSDKIISSG